MHNPPPKYPLGLTEFYQIQRSFVVYALSPKLSYLPLEGRTSVFISVAPIAPNTEPCPMQETLTDIFKANYPFLIAFRMDFIPSAQFCKCLITPLGRCCYPALLKEIKIIAPNFFFQDSFSCGVPQYLQTAQPLWLI